MSEILTVAAVGRIEDPFGAFTWTGRSAVELDVPYEDLPKVTMEMSEEATLQDVLARAIRDLGITEPRRSAGHSLVDLSALSTSSSRDAGQPCGIR